MGKVYEAMNKAENNPPQPVWQRAPFAAPQSNPDPNAEDFDFVRYSLSAPAAEETEKAEHERAAQDAARRQASAPAREVTVDPARIDPHLVAFYEVNPEAAEQFTNLAISIIGGAAQRPLKRLLVTSAQRGEGRTSVALNLACALSQAGKRVLVVDGDFRRPSALRLLGIEAEAGLRDVVTRGVPAGQTAVRVLPYGFVVLPTRERVDNAAELLTAPAFRDMLAALDPDYDFILFDSSPLLDTKDATLLAQMTDATLLVVRAGRTSSAQMARAIAPLSRQHMFGVVLNRAQPPA